jgi:hypothetical protein
MNYEEMTFEDIQEHQALLLAFKEKRIDRAEFVVREMAITENWGERKITRKIMLRRTGRTTARILHKILTLGLG